MRTEYFLLFIVSVSVTCLGCGTDVSDKKEIVYSTDLKEFDLTRPARKITSKELWYTDSASIYSDTVQYEDRFYFDSLGNQVKAEHWNIPAQDWLVEEWTYDTLGHKLTSKFHRGHCGNTAKYFYDDQNKLIRKEIFASDDTLMNVELYKYDISGNMISITIELKHMACGAEVGTTRVFDYDDHGRCIRTRSYSESLTYDNCISYSGDTVFRYPYGTNSRSGTYVIKSQKDSLGSWTHKRNADEHRNGKLRVYETTRIIEYY